MVPFIFVDLHGTTAPNNSNKSVENSYLRLNESRHEELQQVFAYVPLGLYIQCLGSATSADFFSF